MYKLEKDKIIFYGKNIATDCLKLLGEGGNAKVHQITLNGQDEYAFKIFKRPTKKLEEASQSVLGVTRKSYVTPIRIVYFEDDFKGYIMKVCKRRDLSQRILNILVDEFQESSKELYDDTEELSKERLCVFDTFPSNVMYDGGFKMVSTDNYYKAAKNDSVEAIASLNKRRINQLLFDIFVRSTKTADLFYSDGKINRLGASFTSGKIGFDEFFGNILEMGETFHNEKIKTLGGLGNTLNSNYYSKLDD